jgi:hypothetical protein
MEVGDQHHAPVALTPGMTQYTLYRRLDGPQPATSHYTACMIKAHNKSNKIIVDVERLQEV